MRRREFIALLGSAATWPLAARAQQATMLEIGLLSSGSPDAFANRIVALRQGLAESNFVEGVNVSIQYRWAHGQYDRLPALAGDLVRRQVAAIVAPGIDTALAAKSATATIPIVFIVGTDPVSSGLVTSMNRPEGNITGICDFTAEVVTKRLGLLHEMLPSVKNVAVLINPNNANAGSQLTEFTSAARALGLQLHILNANNEHDIDTAFESLLQMRAQALAVGADPFFASQRDRLITLAARYAVPTIYEWEDFAESGGLMSYGSSITDGYRLAGNYAGKILKGDKPADLPIMQPVKFELVINLKAAKAIGLEIPPQLLARADEIIE